MIDQLGSWRYVNGGHHANPDAATCRNRVRPRMIVLPRWPGSRSGLVAIESFSPYTDVAGYGNTGSDADSRAHFRNFGTQALLDLAGGGKGAAGVIVECRRRSENRQRCVALELVVANPPCASTSSTMTSKNRLSSATTAVGELVAAMVVEPMTSTKRTATSRSSRRVRGCGEPRLRQPRVRRGARRGREFSRARVGPRPCG